MHQSTRRALLWQGVSLLLYAGGLGLFLTVAVGVYAAEPAGSVANLTTRDLLFLLVSVGFLVGGRLVGVRFGVDAPTMTDSVGSIRSDRPEPTKLEELGYRVPPDPENDPDREYAYEDGTLYRVCTECGANNDSDYQFCRECSAQLPE